MENKAVMENKTSNELDVYCVDLYLCTECKNLTSNGISTINIIYTPEGRCCHHLSELDIKWGNRK